MKDSIRCIVLSPTHYLCILVYFLVFVMLIYTSNIIDLIAVTIVILSMYSIIIVGIMNNSKMIFKK